MGEQRAAGLVEAHVDVVLKFLKLVSDAEYTAYLQRKLVEWYTAALKSDRRVLPERRPTKRPRGGGREGEGGVRNPGWWQRCLIWISKLLLPDFEAREDIQTYGLGFRV